jgi:hypothetical protein
MLLVDGQAEDKVQLIAENAPTTTTTTTQVIYHSFTPS